MTIRLQMTTLTPMLIATVVQIVYLNAFLGLSGNAIPNGNALPKQQDVELLARLHAMGGAELTLKDLRGKFF